MLNFSKIKSRSFYSKRSSFVSLLKLQALGTVTGTIPKAQILFVNYSGSSALKTMIVKFLHVE